MPDDFADPDSEPFEGSVFEGLMKATGFVESGNRTSPLARNSFNLFGRTARKGNMRFDSIPELSIARELI